MGGQACIFYGAAEFSRDLDLALALDARNLERFRALLADLDAVRIAVPPFGSEYLLRGHALHFRARAAEVERLRLDVMAVMRGVAPFAELWDRRTTATLPDGEVVEMLSLPDLVAAKKTQRDKDWPMIRRLVEASYFADRANPTPEVVRFWLRELRTADLILTLVAQFPDEAGEVSSGRAVVGAALWGDREAVERALVAEEEAERRADRIYWEPLRRELAELRRGGGPDR
jgi:hypothetical protein